MPIHRHRVHPRRFPAGQRAPWQLAAILAVTLVAAPLSAEEIKGADEIVRALSEEAASTTDEPSLRFRGIRPEPKPGASRPAQRIDLKVHFATDSDKILPRSRAQVREIANATKRLNLGTGTSSNRLLIVGHTDSRGPDDYNLDLSERRARAVKQALVADYGVPADALLIRGKGESELLVEPEHSPADYAKNRRVELRLLDGSSVPL